MMPTYPTSSFSDRSLNYSEIIQDNFIFKYLFVSQKGLIFPPSTFSSSPLPPHLFLSSLLEGYHFHSTFQNLFMYLSI